MTSTGYPRFRSLALKLAFSCSFAAIAVGQTVDASCSGTTYAVTECLSRIYTTVDTQLDQVYGKALAATGKSYTAADLNNLREAERIWILYKTAACNAEYGLWGGGSGGPVAHLSCLIRLTRQRTDDLTNVYHLH